MFILYVDNLHSLIRSSSLRIYADDVALYAEISFHQDLVNLQDDLNLIYDWSLTWQLKLSLGKCEVLNITNKRSPISFTYTIGCTSVVWCNRVKYLGVIITSNLNGMITANTLYRKLLGLLTEYDGLCMDVLGKLKH